MTADPDDVRDAVAAWQRTGGGPLDVRLLAWLLARRDAEDEREAGT